MTWAEALVVAIGVLQAGASVTYLLQGRLGFALMWAGAALISSANLAVSKGWF